MNQLDVYYKALLEYKKITGQSIECNRSLGDFAALNVENDKITVSRSICSIDEEWVAAIEEGLVHIEKAIKEERQFIYSNGDVVPIEKVKNVSKETVTHLAKHSDLITRTVESGDIIPDKLYTVERLNDYAVYENRFLYMLLCYLRDFVTIRYNKLLELSNRYEGSLRIEKTMTTLKQKISYKVILDEEHTDDAFLREHNESKDLIDRIDLILKTILAFLATPLMDYASKAAMLKPPITKTNVLKMDNNFKGAVALYDFIISYDKDGYSYEKRTTELAPFKDEIAEDMSEAGILLSFLTYQYGLDIKNTLKVRYEKDEAQRKFDELKKKTEQLEALKRRLKTAEKDIDEYTLELEKHMRTLQLEASKAESLLADVEKLKLSEEYLTKEVDSKKKEINEMIYAHGEEINNMITNHIDEVNNLNSEHEKKVAYMQSEHENTVRSINEKNQAKLEELKNHYDQIDAANKAKIEERGKELDEANTRVDELTSEQNRLVEEKCFLEAQLKALRIKDGLLTEDEQFTDKASFDELEKEFEMFKKFYDSQWKMTKKQIRKNSLKWENFKGQGKQD